MYIESEVFEDLDPTEERASSLEVGDIYAEYGMEPAIVAERGDHGDAVLITTHDGLETTLDSDTVVEVVKGPFDWTSSASRQFWIETGHPLRRDEVMEV